ncbi:TerD family protein [Nocardia australiensis]|uniref:TerD family protein n=1 Tax=Nocardia australiensis TaxID=2887191 RepID=UPI001D145932|nr:TerD family protein [Nocardia australiensis]
MIQLKAGQNIPLTGDVVRFIAKAGAALDVSALVVAANLRASGAEDFVFYNQPVAPGVTLAQDGVTVRLADVRADANAVLLVVSVDPTVLAQSGGLGAVSASLFEKDVATAEFAITPAAGETALICMEVYRRGAGWKLRAVGQGYAGGLTVLLNAHGVEVDEAPDNAGSAAGVAPGGGYSAGTYSAPGHSSGQGLTTGRPADAADPQPLEVAHGLNRLWMIFEDAARSAAALISARDYAAQRLDNELSTAVSDPATRNTPDADAARQAAQRRSDELIVTAEESHRRDSGQLISELAEADRLLPPSLASWDSPAWDGPPIPSDGIRLGELYAAERGELRVPYCVPIPLHRPLWIDTESSSAAAPVVGALLARLLAADPDRRVLVDMIDLTGAFRGLVDPLAPVLNGPPITDHSDISARLQALVDAAELAEMAYNSGVFTPPAEHRVLLAADFPHGYQAADAARIGSLMIRGDLIGLSTMIVGTDESDSTDPAVATLSQSCRHLPTIESTPLFDPWTGSPWQLDLDLLPQEPQRQARYLRTNH